MHLWKEEKNGTKPTFHRPVALLRGGDYRDGWEAGRETAFQEIRTEIKALSTHVSGGLVCYGVLATLIGAILGFVAGKFL